MKLPRISLKHIDNRVRAAVITFGVIAFITAFLSLSLTYPAQVIVAVLFSMITGMVGYFVWGIYRGVLDCLNGER